MYLTLINRCYLEIFKPLTFCSTGYPPSYFTELSFHDTEWNIQVTHLGHIFEFCNVSELIEVYFAQLKLILQHLSYSLKMVILKRVFFLCLPGVSQFMYI